MGFWVTVRVPHISVRCWFQRSWDLAGVDKHLSFPFILWKPPCDHRSQGFIPAVIYSSRLPCPQHQAPGRRPQGSAIGGGLRHPCPPPCSLAGPPWGLSDWQGPWQQRGGASQNSVHWMHGVMHWPSLAAWGPGWRDQCSAQTDTLYGAAGRGRGKRRGRTPIPPFTWRGK